MIRPLSSSPASATARLREPVTSTELDQTTSPKDAFERVVPGSALLAHMGPAGVDTPTTAGGGDLGDRQPSPGDRRAGLFILTETFPSGERQIDPDPRNPVLGLLEPVITR